jgi:hypothetical protein
MTEDRPTWEAWLLHLDGERFQRLGDCTGAPALLPGGAQVVLPTATGLSLVDVQSGEQRQLLAVRDRLRSVLASDDGKYIYFWRQTYEADIWLARLGGASD